MTYTRVPPSAEYVEYLAHTPEQLCAMMQEAGFSDVELGYDSSFNDHPYYYYCRARKMSDRNKQNVLANSGSSSVQALVLLGAVLLGALLSAFSFQLSAFSFLGACALAPFFVTGLGAVVSASGDYELTEDRPASVLHTTTIRDILSTDMRKLRESLAAIHKRRLIECGVNYEGKIKL
jgi:hypothetical protein